jgi:hypothetical protein
MKNKDRTLSYSKKSSSVFVYRKLSRSLVPEWGMHEQSKKSFVYSSGKFF